MTIDSSNDVEFNRELAVRLTAAGVDLPAKLRVHELAKRAGLTSKEVIAGLTALGLPTGSSASSVTNETATQLLTSLQPVLPEPEPVAETATKRPARKRPPAKSKKVESAVPDEDATPAEDANPAKAAPAAQSAPSEEPELFAPDGQATTEDLALAAALEDLPSRSRVHELAKRAGLKPKEVLELLAAQGVTAKSAASVISAADARTLLTTIFAPTSADPASTAQPAAPALPTFDAPLFMAPVAPAPTRSRRSRSAARPEAVVEQGAGEQGSAEQIPAEQSSAELAEVPSETGPVEQAPTETTPGRSRNRRGRNRDQSRSSDAARNDSQAEGTSVSDASGVNADGFEAPGSDVSGTDSPDPQAGELAADGGTAESDESRRRRRRGRRGRGRVGDRDNELRDNERRDGAETGSPADVAEPTELSLDALLNNAGINGAGPSASVEAGAGAEDADGDQGAQDGDDDSEDGGPGSGSRRRRRRRRGSNADEPIRVDDPVDTVVHVREVRSAESQVQGVRGSTRLEAKRQRRRETRDTRRRPQILTEAEFLARRESVHRVMAVRQRGELAQVALLEDGVLVEHFVSRAGSASMIGNVYLGRVQNVLPSMEAAFIDIGRGRNAVLYAGEVNWDAAGLAGKSRKIETALSSGDSILVQVSKDPVGHKGARLTTQISLPGRFLVYVPNGGATGISRKLPDTERKRLKSILDRIVPDDAGVIIRTAAEGVSEEELAHDVQRLQAQWEEILERSDVASGKSKQANPEELYSEPDTLIKVVRDLFNSDITELIIDGDDAWDSLSSYVEQVAPELGPRISRFSGRTDVFAAHRIDEQIAKALERKVHLPSGGSLVIDRTEAMTVVDVNTGKYTGSGGNLEETVTKNNLEAAEEVVRQLRLRDIGGIIVVDFIDMVLESNRELVVRRLTECLGRDRTRHQVAEVTSLGLVQMTRKKMGTGLVEAFSEPCPHCQGRGIVLHDAPVDHSPEQAGGQAIAEEGRSRRNRGRDRGPVPAAAAPVAELDVPVVQVVAPRPPDPRGPKPPSKLVLDAEAFANNDAGAAGQAAEFGSAGAAVVVDVGAIVDQVLALRGAGPAEGSGSGGSGAERSGAENSHADSSSADDIGVAPVQDPVEEGGAEAAAQAEGDAAVQAVADAETPERGRGRRRGSRGGRSRGGARGEEFAAAPSTEFESVFVAEIPLPALPDSAFAETASQAGDILDAEPLTGEEPLDELTERAAQPDVQPAAVRSTPSVIASDDDPLIAELADKPVKPKRVRKPASTRGAKAASTSISDAAGEFDASSSQMSAQETNGTVGAVPEQQPPSVNAADPIPAAEATSGVEAQPAAPVSSAPAPRRRRAASRPAGPPQT